MPKTAGEFINELYKKAGGNPEDEGFKKFLNDANLVSVQIPDDVMRPIDNGLISLTAAKNNHTDIKNHYTKQALDGVDKSIEDLMTELELDETTRNQVAVERSSYKKPATLIKIIRDLEVKKATANAPDKAAINKQLEDLHAQIKVEKQRSTDAEMSFKKQMTDFRRDIKVSSLYSAQKTILDTLDPEAKAVAIKVLIDKELQDNNAQITFDENGNLNLTKKDGTNYFGDNNQQVNAQQFVDKVLSRNKLLVVTPAPQNGNGNQQGNNGQQNQPAPATGANGNTAGANNNSGSGLLKEILQGSMKDMETANNVPIFGNGTAN